MTKCSHTETVESNVRAFFGAVSRDENPAAHGGVCHTETCVQCGARRRVNSNGRHTEEGPWGEDRAARESAARQAESVVRALVERRPADVTLTRGDATARVRIDRDGFLSVSAGGPSGPELAAALPELVAYARELRAACVHAEELRRDV